MRDFRAVVFALIVGSRLAGFFEIEMQKSGSSSVLVEATVTILKTCYGNQVGSVRLAGNFDGTFVRSLFEQSIPLTLINDTQIRIVDRRRRRQKPVRDLRVFVVGASSPSKLMEIVNGLKDFLWWNHLASFIISTSPSVDCSNAHEMLWAAWTVDLLKANLLCLDPASGPMIYGFNPYTENAPHPWKLKKTYAGKNEHPWSLFARKFQEDQGICDEMDFDKTKDLGGYEVRAIVRSSEGFFTIDPNKTGADSFDGVSGNCLKILYRSLNATFKMITTNETQYGAINRLVFDGLSDMVLFPRYQSLTVGVTLTYPHWESGLVIITHYSGEVSQLDKLMSVIDRTSRRGCCLVLVITLLFFKFFVRQSLMSGILNVLRVVVSASVLNVPQNHPPRIYLASLFLFAVTIQGIYQGQLASLLTKPISLANVNSMEDLANSHHTIYSYMAFSGILKKPPFQSRFVALEYRQNCEQLVGPNSSVACVTDRFFIVKKAVEMKLHLSNDVIYKDYWVYVVRQDWPLEERVNVILQRLVEAHLVDYWHNKWTQKSIDQSRYFEKQENAQQFRNITLEELTFAFVMLGIGLSFATVVFFIEFFINLAR